VPSTEKGRANLDAAKKRLKLYEAEQPELEAKLAQVDADLAAVSSQKAIGELNVPDQTTRYRKGAIDVESWRPDVYLGRDRREYREGVQKLLQNERSGDLSKALLDSNGNLFPARVGGQDLAYLKEHPEVWEATHVLTKGEGKDVLVICSSYRNQVRGHDLEHTGKVLSDRARVIQGIAIDELTAWDLVTQGRLDGSVVLNAKVIQLAR
jgi:hypothetical protein